ncbi:MAG: polysaccharide biosynthesis/export family protein, partial [Pseudomonadota bacterium]
MIGRVTALLALFLTFWHTVPAAALEYRIGPYDRLVLRVLIWDDDLRQYEYWDAVSGEYGVGPEGLLAVPLAGSVEAEGFTAAEIADRV